MTPSWNDPEPVESRWPSVVLGVVVGVALIAMLVGAYRVGYDHGSNRGPVGAATAPTSQPPASSAPGGAVDLAAGKATFQGTCGGCHTLSDAGSTGQVGPNLDQLAPSEQRVLAAIANGGTGSGTMPAGLVSGSDAASVAAYVSSVAGR